MRLASLTTLTLLLSLTACSSGRVVVSGGSHPGGGKPGPPHAVRGPVASLGIPPGHYPPPGQCRVWVPGTPPGHQPKPSPCTALNGNIPVGAWVIYRPSKDKKAVEVTAYHKSTPALVVSVHWYDVASGKLLVDRTGGKGKGHGHGKGKGGKGKS